MEQISSAATKKTEYKMTFRKIWRAALAEIRVHKKLAIISFVLFGVAMLMYAIFNAYGFHPNDDIKQIRYMPSGWGETFSILGIIVGFFTALSIFRDMNNQQLCDVSMALPIKASERFLSKITALLLLQTAPLTVSVAGGNALSLLFISLKYTGFSFYEDTAETLGALVFGSLAASMFILAVTVLVTCCCGTLAESSYFSIILMFIINVFPMSFFNNLIVKNSGFSYGNILFGTASSDFAFDFGWWGFLFLTRNGNKEMMSHAAVGSIVSLAVMLLAGLIYVRRDARSVGMPISSKVFFEIMMAGSCITIFSLSFMSSGANWGILIAGVGYIIINVIVSRAKINGLSFIKWAAKYAATLAAFVIVAVIALKTGGFGYINLRPEAQYLDGARFSLRYFVSANRQPDGSYSKDNKLYSSPLTPEQADEVMKICKKYFVKAAAERSPFDIFSDTVYSYDGSTHTYLTVTADSDTKYGFRPFPKSMFDKGFEVIGQTGDTVYTVKHYSLDYYQHMTVPISEADAMFEELKELGYLSEDSPSELVPETTLA